MRFNRTECFGIIIIGILLTSCTVLAQSSLQLGGEEEENNAMVLWPKQIEEGPDGNLYVLDGGDSFIKVYAPDGEFLGKLGGPGEGPGEFQRTDGAFFGFTTAGNLFFTEFFGGHRWITVMKLDGDLIRTVAPQFEASYGISNAVALEDGGFLITFVFDSAAYPGNDLYLYNLRRALVRIDSEGSVVSQIIETEYPSMISLSPNGGTMSLPFIPKFTWAVTTDGGVIWSDGLSPDFTVMNFDGTSTGIFKTDLPEPEKVTSEDLNYWRSSRKEMLIANDAAWWNRFGRVIEKYDHSLFDNIPLLQKISSVPGGNLLIQRSGNPDTDLNTYWLLDGQGKLISTVTTEVWSLQISRHFVMFFSEYEDGSTAVNVVRWSGAVDQALDFLK